MRLKNRYLLPAVLFLLSVVSCTHLFYQPWNRMIYDPAKFGYEYRDVNFQSADGTPLHGWFFPVAAGKKELGTVVQFHGNAENISSHFLSLVWITRHGYNLFTFDYQGYGLSGGRPTQKNLNADALAALRWVKTYNESKKERLKFIAFGQSIGGTILLRALYDFEEKEAIDSVVIESSFPSYKRIAREKFSESWITWLFQPLGYLLTSERYAPETKIREVSPVPLLVIHGDADRIVPIHHGRRIYRLAGEPKFFWEIPGGRHIDSMIRHDGKYRQKLLEFLDGL